MPENADFVLERSARTARRVAAQLSLSALADITTLRDAYVVAYQFPAPLMVRVADDMLADLRDDACTPSVARRLA